MSTFFPSGAAGISGVSASPFLPKEKETKNGEEIFEFSDVKNSNGAKSFFSSIPVPALAPALGENSQIAFGAAVTGSTPPNVQKMSIGTKFFGCSLALSLS